MEKDIIIRIYLDLDNFIYVLKRCRSAAPIHLNEIQKIIVNKIFIQVSPYYPSSQICSKCGNRNEEMKDIRVRELKCSKCGLEIERDYNASINILNEGLRCYNN